VDTVSSSSVTGGGPAGSGEVGQFAVAVRWTRESDDHGTSTRNRLVVRRVDSGAPIQQKLVFLHCHGVVRSCQQDYMRPS
jgi:hypothetical protein